MATRDPRLAPSETRREGSEDPVAGWLKGLVDTRQQTAWDSAETAPVKADLGPIELTPLPQDDPHEGIPLAKAFFGETLHAVHNLAPGGKGLAELSHNVERFLEFTRSKLAYLYQALKAKDRPIFSVIPYLLHTNASGLPGYQAAHDAPYGISNFDLNASIRQAVEEVFGIRGVRGTALRKPAVLSLLAMGSVGTIGQSGKSDIDYWVVVDEQALGKAGHAALEERVAAIESWVRKRGLDVHFFLVDAERARRDEFGTAQSDVDSSGSAQGKLLKEEFYRTAIFIAGQMPLWWVAPVGIDSRGYHRLVDAVDRAALPPQISFVDLGFLGQIDRGEFFGAALWQINKSLRSPFKSLLKMALLARYLDDEHPRLLCEELKERVFQGEDAPQYTDPYVLLFDAISEYFADHGDWAAFRLIQKCFYLKVGLKLSRLRSDRSRFMRRFRVMKAYVTRWGWDADLLAELDAMETWSAEKVDAIGQSIRQFMLGLYRQLIQRARAATVRISETDITILGRRLFASFGQEVGKIQHLFTYFLKEPRTEDRVMVVEDSEAPPSRRWEVHRELSRERLSSRGEPVFSGSSVAEVAAWLTFNGLFHRGTVVGLVPTESRATTAEFRGMLERFHVLFESPDPFSIKPSLFLEPRQLRRAALLVNFDQLRTPQDASEQAGVFYLPENWDILNYGRRRESRLQDLSLVTLNSWGEVFCRRFTGARALSAALHSLYDLVDQRTPLETPIEIMAPSDRTMAAVRNRIRELLTMADEVFIKPLKPKQSRTLVYEVGGHFQILHRSTDGRRICSARSPQGVTRLLGNAGYDEQVVLVDKLSPSLGDIRALLARHERERDARALIGYRVGKDSATLLVLDETRRIYSLQTTGARLDDLLAVTVRRILLHVRQAVASVRDLRRSIRVFEMREGRGLGEETLLVDETSRVLTSLSEIKSQRRELWLRGNLHEGRDGIYFEHGGEVISPGRFGRSFAYQLVLRLLADHSQYDPTALRIDGSTVDFGPAHRPEGIDRGVVKHLRLMDLYERHLVRALSVYRGDKKRLLTTTRGFRRSP